MNDLLEACTVEFETKIYFDNDEGKFSEEKSDIKAILTNGRMNGFKFFDIKTGKILSKEAAEETAFNLLEIKEILACTPTLKRLL